MTNAHTYTYSTGPNSDVSYDSVSDLTYAKVKYPCIFFKTALVTTCHAGVSVCCDVCVLSRKSEPARFNLVKTLGVC